MDIPRFQTFGQYRDAWAGIILFAPDQFTSYDLISHEPQLGAGSEPVAG